MVPILIPRGKGQDGQVPPTTNGPSMQDVGERLEVFAPYTPWLDE